MHLFHRSREKLPSLTESGSILVPVSYPVHSLIAFIKTSHYKAKQLARNYERFACYNLP